MNKFHRRRLVVLSITSVSITIAVGLILYALKNNINVFLTPSEIPTQLSANYHFRLGGMVKPGSLKTEKMGLGVAFIVTDLKKELPVHYEGILPDLFREGKGVIADGNLNNNGIFIASYVLAKHDENYTPKKGPK